MALGLCLVVTYMVTFLPGTSGSATKVQMIAERFDFREGIVLPPNVSSIGLPSNICMAAEVMQPLVIHRMWGMER